jgi:hypothetical protein
LLGSSQQVVLNLLNFYGGGKCVAWEGEADEDSLYR